MSHTFLWHDYETFGKVPRSDRPSQFAGIRTDSELNEIGEPIEVFCRPSDDYLPHPEACLITHITPQDCIEKGVSEREFTAIIHKELSQPNTVGVGYNTIQFDDEVTRHLLWRNMIDPYAREWQNGCSRWDLIDVARTFHLFSPEGIEWPTGIDGTVSFKLELLSKANGIIHEKAHDAVSDVRATIEFAKLLRNKDKNLFDFCFSLRKKDAVLDQVQGVGNTGVPVIHISSLYGKEKGGMGLAFPLAIHPTNKNEIIMWNLAKDPSELLNMDAEQIRFRMFSKKEDLASQNLERMPLQKINVSKTPIVISDMAMLTKEMIAKFEIDINQINKNIKTIRSLPNLYHIWNEVYAPPDFPPLDPEQDLSGGFLGNQDRRILDMVNKLQEPQFEKAQPSFTDMRLIPIFERYKARNFPNILSDTEKEKWANHCKNSIELGFNGLSVKESLERIEALKNSEDENPLNQSGLDILEKLKKYTIQLANKYNIAIPEQYKQNKIEIPEQIENVRKKKIVRKA